VEVLDDVLAVLFDNACVIAGSAIVAKHQMVVGVASHQERKRMDAGASALSGRMQDQESGWRRPGAHFDLMASAHGLHFRLGPRLSGSHMTGQCTNKPPISVRAKTISKSNCDATWPRTVCSGSPKNSSTRPQRRQMICACSCLSRVS